MTALPSHDVIFLTFTVLIFSSIPSSNPLGTGSTISITDASATVCGIVAGQPTQRIACFRGGEIINVNPNISFSSISGGRKLFCGLWSTRYTLLCWENNHFTANFITKRLYSSRTVVLENLAVGNDHICATIMASGAIECWRGNKLFESPSGSDQFVSISSGSGYSCGILKNSKRVRCWGSSSVSSEIENGFGEMVMLSLVAGDSHVCGLNVSGLLVCQGSNSSGQLGAPLGEPMEYWGLALGKEHSCAIRSPNNSVVCWGGGGKFSANLTDGVSFEMIVSGLNFTCGLTTSNFSIICWGPGWVNDHNSRIGLLPEILPGPCVQSSCTCGPYPQSQRLCFGSGNICKPCFPPPMLPLQPPLLDSPESSPSRALRGGLLAMSIVGSIGAFAGLCTVIYCFWTGVCFGKKKIHNSVQPTITRESSSNAGGTSNNNSPPSIPAAIRRQGSLILRRQRSGTSSKHTDKAKELSLAELAAATNNFSNDNKIGAGSFGIVYRGKLSDGREVAIKRGETSAKKKRFQEKESAFESELVFLSRLHHKHLVRLVGYCQEKDERLLVYDYMKNGALHDHLHDKNNVDKSSSVLNSWRMRIKVALDASRGTEYLHNYAVPPIIHRDIKSSNILLDVDWTARVSDFGLSLMGPELDHNHGPMKAAGTVGYIDPEYYGLNVLTAKSDVYGIGVVLLELLTGKRALFKNGGNRGMLMSVVDYAVPAIKTGELVKVLDPRVGPPEINEAEAVELVAYTASHCVNLEGKDRPMMSDVVANLERAFALCDDTASHCVNLEGKGRPMMTDVVANLERAFALYDRSPSSDFNSRNSVVLE